MPKKARPQAFLAPLIYVIVAGICLLSSDLLLNFFIHDPDLRAQIAGGKGWGLLVLSGGWFYLVLWLWSRNWERETQERGQAAESLQESNQKFSRLFHSSPVPMSLSTKREGRFVDVNAEFLNLLQRSREEVVGRTSFDLNLWLDSDQRAALIARLEGRGTVRNLEMGVRTKSGEIRQVFWSGEQVAIAGEDYLVGSLLDITGQKLAVQKVSESEERYRQLFEMESNAVLLVDGETRRFVDANQAALRLYGYDREEFLKLRLEDVAAEVEETRATVGSGNVFIPLRWHRKKNGDRFAVEITASPIQHQGRLTELTTIRDITVHQQMMEILQDSTRQLLEAQRIASLGSYVIDIRTGTWNSSQVLDDLFGITVPGFKRDLNGWLQIIHPQDRAAMREHLLEEVGKGRAAYDRTYRIVRLNDQQERWVHGLGKPVLDEAGQVVQLLGAIQDITVRKRAEAQMTLQLSAMNSAANGIVITDRDGKIEWVNPAFTRLTGYASREAVGSHTSQFKSSQQPADFYATVRAAVLAGKVWQGEVFSRRKDGQTYTEEMTVTPVRGADNQISHFVEIRQDVTERRLYESRLQQAQKMEAIGTLASGIAHDFNNILAAMFSFGYLLQQDTEGNPAAQERVAEILKAAERAKDLVQQILTFSRQHEQKRLVLRLDNVLQETVKFLCSTLPAGIKIETQFAASTPMVLADPTQIYQMTVKLATNALQAMDGRPGRLTFQLKKFQPDAAFLQAHPDFRPIEYAQLTVTDTGQGMDAKTLERIFEPFFTTKPVVNGTGLGLAVVHGIVQSHEGCITVTSEVGQGTTFHLYFPAQAPEAAPPDTAPASLPRGAGQNILVVDDELALTKAFQTVLQRLNYQPTVSNLASETIGLFREHPERYALAITDLTMPEMNGLEVARQLRAIRPELPVILISGFNSVLTPAHLREAGICQLIEKPVAVTVLADAMQRALAGNGGDS